MRWELNEVARRLDQRSRTVELHDELLHAPETSGSGLSPNTRLMLQAIESLPDDDREAFELVRIQGMTPSEAAGIVGVTDRTMQRRLNRALLRLMGMLEGLRPRERAGEAPRGDARVVSTRPPEPGPVGGEDENGRRSSY
jgi:RNA polymerase sigma-70 factor (ECF subfamily)